MNASCISIHPRFPIKITHHSRLSSPTSLSIISPTVFPFYPSCPFHIYSNLSVYRVNYDNSPTLNPCLKNPTGQSCHAFVTLLTPQKPTFTYFHKGCTFFLCLVSLKHLSFLTISHFTSTACFSRFVKTQILYPRVFYTRCNSRGCDE